MPKDLSAEPNTVGFDELELLGKLVELHEDGRKPVAHAGSDRGGQVMMEQAGLRPRGLIPIIGSASKVSEDLAHKRPLALAMIRTTPKHTPAFLRNRHEATGSLKGAATPPLSRISRVPGPGGRSDRAEPTVTSCPRPAPSAVVPSGFHGTLPF